MTTSLYTKNDRNYWEYLLKNLLMIKIYRECYPNDPLVKSWNELQNKIDKLNSEDNK